MGGERRSESREYFRKKDGVESLAQRIFNVHGAISFFNPTSAYFQNIETDTFRRLEDSTQSHASVDGSQNATHSPNSDPSYHWTSRNNRKGVHELAVSRERANYDKDTYKNELSFWRSVLINIRRMLTRFPYWDISYLIAISFLVGSGIWIIDGVITFLPIDQPSKALPGQDVVGGGILAFVGTCVFFLANLLLWVETINEPRNQCYGWSAEYKVDEASGFSVKMVPGPCQSHHGNRSNLVGSGPKDESTKRNDQNGGANGHSHNDESRWPNPQHDSSSRNNENTDESRWPNPHYDSSSRSNEEADEHTALLGHQSSTPTDNSSAQPRSWRWYPTWRELKEHYLHEISFVAVSIQLLGAVLFLFGAFPRLPPIYTKLSRTTEEALFYVPKLAGGICFVFSNVFYLLETQDYWFIPAPWSIGWHIGGWSIVGSFGFALSSGFGLSMSQFWQYQSALAVIWASSAFFAASILMWYESLNKYTMHQI